MVPRTDRPTTSGMAHMTDDRDLDIVSELRILAELADSSDVGLVMLSGRSFTDAADEIEALRDRHDRTDRDRHDVGRAPVPEYRNDHADEVEQ